MAAGLDSPLLLLLLLGHPRGTKNSPRGCRKAPWPGCRSASLAWRLSPALRQRRDRLGASERANWAATVAATPTARGAVAATGTERGRGCRRRRISSSSSGAGWVSSGWGAGLGLAWQNKAALAGREDRRPRRVSFVWLRSRRARFFCRSPALFASPPEDSGLLASSSGLPASDRPSLLPSRGERDRPSQPPPELPLTY